MVATLRAKQLRKDMSFLVAVNTWLRELSRFLQ